VGIDDGEHIYQACQELGAPCRVLRLLAHPPQERRLVASVRIEPAILVTADDLEKLLVEPALLRWRVGPECVALFSLPGVHYHAESVDESAFEIPL
jgi:hypothetical protein